MNQSLPQSPSARAVDGVSIGAVARETGISPDTIRIWERRYGSPSPIRLPSGHRRYPREEIERLQLVLRLLDAGYRPHEVVASSGEELLRLLNRSQGKGGKDNNGGKGSAPMSDWILASRNLDGSALTTAFHDDWVELGPLRFVEERVVPAMRHVGEAWAAGALSVSEEHFISDHLTNFLSTQWRRLAERAPGAPVLMASLPRDDHHFGLLMCAVVAAAADHRVVYLGGNTPPSEVVATANRIHPAAVCLSVSITLPSRDAKRQLMEIRSGIPDEIPMAVGGEGAPDKISGLHHFKTLRGWHRWLRDLP